MPAPVVTSGSQTSPFGNGGQWLCEATNTPASWSIIGSPPTGVSLFTEGGPSDTYVTWDDTTPVGEHVITVRATNGSGTGDGTLTLTIESTTSPVVSSVSPSSGTTAGGTAITITGENFVSGASVFVGPNAATSVVVVSATSITCVTPAGTAGAKTVTVRNPDSSEGVLFSGFTYTSPTTTTTTTTTTTSTTTSTTTTSCRDNHPRFGLYTWIPGCAPINWRNSRFKREQ